ncbi:MAG: AAA family ATPase [Elusimicrobiota bacterium]
MSEQETVYNHGNTFYELVDLVIHVTKSGRVPFIWGQPGIGKSALARTVAAKLGCEYCCLDAPLLQPFDYAVAVPDHVKKEITLYRTGFIPQKGPAVVAIEDLPHAKPYQQVPLMQLVLDHRIGPMHISKDVYFIATGNREEDNAFTQPIPSPLLNRMCHFTLNASYEEWVYRFARPNNVDERVVGFVLSNPEFFAQQPKEGVRAWPTPRSLHAFADIIKNINDENVIRSIGIGTIGEVATKFFLEWLKYLRCIDPKQVIVEGILPKFDSQDRSQVLAIVLSIGTYCAKLNEQSVIQHGNNIIRFFNALSSDYKVLFCHQFIDYDNEGNRNVQKLSYLQNIKGSDKMFKNLAEVLLEG